MIRSLLSSGGATKCRTIDKLDIFGDGSCKALYRLDGNANDESGNYHGTETNVTYGGGVYERGAVFNGSGYISTSLLQGNTLSYSFWLKTTSTANQCFISDADSSGSATTTNCQIYITSGNLAIDRLGSSNIIGSFAPYANNAYNHFVVSVSNTNVLTYINGTLVNTWIKASGTPTTNPLIVGRIGGYSGFYTNGSIDQVRIFNRAITAQEVATLYAECEPTSIVDNINPFEDGSLKALYKFDNDATDATGVHNGVATNVTYASGKFGNCMVGTVSNYIDTLSNFSFMTGTNAFSWSVWIKRNDSATTEQNIFTQLQTVGGAYSHGLELYNNTIRIFFNNSSMYTISAPTDTTIWHHIAVSKIGSIMSIYLDGKPTQFTSVVSLALYSPTWMIGRGASSYGFNGSIDQLRIFNKALTPLEVASLYNETTPMEEPMSVQVDPFKDGSGKALYRLDGNALDESGNYHGTPTALTYGLGRFVRCGVFNGISSNVTANTFKLPIGAKTLSFWVKSIVSSNYNQIINDSDTGYNGSAGITGTAVAFDLNTGKIFFKVKENPVNSNIFTLISATSVTDGSWHHVVCLWDGTTTANAAKIYIDGVLSIAGTASGLQTSIPEGYLTVGRPYGAASYFFNGSLDQVRIFNRALTQSEVTALYNEI